MKKLNFIFDAQRLTKQQMKNIVGGENPSTQCYYHCCDDDDENCSPYTTNGRACSSAADCANPNGSGCGSGHLFWSCH